MSILELNNRYVCPVCSYQHSPTVKCSYDTLVNLISILRRERSSLVIANREATDIAKEFQNVLRSMEPEISRLVAIELLYKKTIGEKNNGAAEFSAQAPPPS